MQNNTAQIEFWNSHSGRRWVAYEDELNLVFQNVNSELIRRSQPAPGETVLDIGCGTGATGRAFSQHLAPGGTVTGLDISAPLLAQAENRAEESETEMRYHLLDAQVDAIPGGPFDLVVSRFGVMFFSDPVAAFANIHRHMASDGRLVVAAWAPIADNPWFKIPRDAAVAQLGEPDPTNPNAPGPLGFQNIDHVVGVLKSAGFANARGEVCKIMLSHPGPTHKLAALAANLGPAARILKKYDGNSDDLAAIQDGVLRQLQAFETSRGLNIPARLNVFEAIRE
ncbi:methyltransferase domain-containing protein [Parasedimentitalea maritima]|uniref:Methyltransferase domain-containing protein n=1 Tax=Parasedimentitalea maritima TaxID=2578117 RepID=A0A6A4REI9_9RHOB|nr:methyltransferase domain-containing protein [Zongyanglinia marina]